MATPEQLQALLEEPRNGCNSYIRHPLARTFYYTDGVQEVAALCGAYWLLDIVGTEVCAAFHKAYTENYLPTILLELNVQNYEMTISFTDDDDRPPLYSRHVEFTDFPEGFWVFKLGIQGDNSVIMCLLSED